MKCCENKLCTAVKWAEVRASVHEKNLELGEILDSLPREAFPDLISARYPFGAEIVADGIFKLPCRCRFCDEMQDRLRKRTSIPLAVVISNRIEVLKSSATHRTEPLRILRPGDLFGAFETADFIKGYLETQKWTLNAGARTIIPLWAHKNEYVRLAINSAAQDVTNSSINFDNRSGDGNQWHSQFWPFIKEMARAVDPGWYVDVLIIDANWLDLDYKQPLRCYIFETAWKQSRELRERGQTQDNIVVSAIANKIARCAWGDSVGFSPSMQGGENGPFSDIQKLMFSKLVEIYKKKAGGAKADSVEMKRLPPLPLLLFPQQMTSSSSSGAGLSKHVSYLALNNSFVVTDAKAAKYSAQLSDLSYHLSKLNKKMPPGINLELFIGDSATVGIKTKKRSNYIDDYFGIDFEEQLKLATLAGWGLISSTLSAPRENIHTQALSGKDESFFAAFARLSS